MEVEHRDEEVDGDVSVRIGFTLDASATKPSSVIVIESSYRALAKTAAQKLKLNKKVAGRMSFYVVSGTQKATAGTQIPMSKDLSDYLANDTLVFVDTQGAATPAHFENKKKGVAEELPWATVGTGRLCARGAPSAKKVREWKEAGATAVVTLLRSDENQIGPIEAACTGQELVWLHLPLSGKKAVASEQSQRSDFDNRSLSRAVEVAELLQQGASVIVHCAAGMHRTGVMCYLAQRYAGVMPEEAVQNIRATREVTYIELLKTTRNNLTPLLHLAEQHFASDTGDSSGIEASLDLHLEEAVA